MAFWAVAQVEPWRDATAQFFLRAAGFETYDPRIAHRRIIRKQAVTRTTQLFTGYIFVRIVLRWHVINATIGVRRLLMDGDRPARLDDAVIDEIRAKEVRGIVRLPSPPSRFGTPGRSEVRVVKGVFSGRSGIYQGMSDRGRGASSIELVREQDGGRLRRQRLGLTEAIDRRAGQSMLAFRGHSMISQRPL
jgi:transcriptional antiterminator RfaH